MEIIQNKLIRDLQDYKTGTVYNWTQISTKTSNPCSILKNSISHKHHNPNLVSFSSTKIVSSDTQSEPPNRNYMITDIFSNITGGKIRKTNSREKKRTSKMKGQAKT